MLRSAVEIIIARIQQRQSAEAVRQIVEEREEGQLTEEEEELIEEEEHRTSFKAAANCFEENEERSEDGEGLHRIYEPNQYWTLPPTMVANCGCLRR